MRTYSVLLGVYLITTLVQGKNVTEDSDDDICTHLPEVGDCKAAIPQWFYNSSISECEEFVYGGCPGESQNRFPTKEACVRKCNSSICLQPPAVGDCRGAIPKWFYEEDSRHCQEFVWGGCGGNQNNFDSQDSCERACAGVGIPCELGGKFQTVGKKTVTSGARQTAWFTSNCETRCRKLCTDNHHWGVCMSFSIASSPFANCDCYLYDRYLSKTEFESDSQGISRNRMCKAGSVPDVDERDVADELF